MLLNGAAQIEEIAQFPQFALLHSVKKFSEIVVANFLGVPSSLIGVYLKAILRLLHLATLESPSQKDIYKGD
jgi:hypothetical protein